MKKKLNKQQKKLLDVHYCAGVRSTYDLTNAEINEIVKLSAFTTIIPAINSYLFNKAWNNNTVL